MRTEDPALRRGLNPFFIRSAVGMAKEAVAVSFDGLNPFFIRSAVGIKVVRGIEADRAS